MRFLTVLFALFFSTLASAEGIPQPLSPYVSDYAQLMTPEAHARVTADLEKLRKDTGVEMAVVTLEYSSDHGPYNAIEPFATALFNEWGIGNADTNNGILILILRKERAMRIELGAGYGPINDDIAQIVIDDYAIPYFRKDEYSQGIEAVSTETIKRIAMPFANGEEPRKPAGAWLDFIIYGAFAAFAAVAFLGGTIATKLSKCPSCGRRGGMSRDETVLSEATKGIDGMKETHSRCRHCDYEDRTRRSYRYRSSSSSGSFGGGRSSGGGASGRW